MSCCVCTGPAERFLPFRGIPTSVPLVVEAFRGRWVSRCRHCEHVFCDPPPAAELLERYYAQTPQIVQPPSVRDRIARSRIGNWLLSVRVRAGLERWPVASEQLRAIEAAVPPVSRERWGAGIRTLELGAGSAAFSRTMRARYGVHAACDVVEPASDHVATYRRHGLRLVARTLGAVDEGLRYRVVHSAHFLEHLPDPRAAFSKIRRMVEPHGIVFTEVPNCEAPYWDVFNFPDPPHVQYFTLASLRALAEACGFTVCSLETAGEPLGHDPGFLLPTTPELIDDEHLFHLMARRREKLRSKRRGDSPFAQRSRRENIRLVMKPA